MTSRSKPGLCSAFPRCRLSRHFPLVYTIEINRELYEKAAARFKDQ